MMPLRDIFVTAVVLISLPYILIKPYFGIYVWSWLSYMNPHRLSWSFAYDFPFAYIVALTTLAGMLFSRGLKRIPWTRESVLLLLFVLWMLITTIFAVHQSLAWEHLEKVAKIQLMIFLTLILIDAREKLHTLVWIIALSLGFYGVKGGIFTILHGGVYEVRGPLGTFIGGNNEIALALIMVIPLMRYLQMNTKETWIRHGLTAAMILSAFAVIGSQSRGALLGLATMGVFLWLKSRNKILTGILMAVAAGLILTVMPQQWYDRMATTEHYEQDASAMGRINAWGMAFNLAKDRPLGGGFDTFSRDMFAQYAPDPRDVHDSHSIYFEVLGEHGFAGLGLFLLLGLFTWRSATWVIKTARGDPETRWLADLTGMIQVSMVGYASAGAFLGLAYFDYYYNLVAVVVLCKVIMQQRLSEPQRKPVPVSSGSNAVPAMATRRVRF